MKKLVAAIEEHVAFYGPHGNRSLSFPPPFAHTVSTRLRRRVNVARYASDPDDQVKVLACFGWHELTRVLQGMQVTQVYTYMLIGTLAGQ